MKEKNNERNKTKDSNTLFKERSPAEVALDSLVRRKLRVSDPTNAVEVAEALGKLYVVDREAMDREAAGLPYMVVPTLKAMPPVFTSSHAELEQAKKDVEIDLTALAANALLKDIQPELNGWASAIRTAITDGINAARFALDPRQRAKTFSIRRLLGDYARVARFVGALTPTMNLYYRHLAKSLDEVAGVLLVLIGDALANIGFGGGRFILQVPVSELQERRDAVIYALRNLIGSTQEAYGSDEWPRGLHAYRQLLSRLDTSGQSDLKALFQENNIARLMDDLIVSATSGGPEDLRSLGSTAHLALGRFRRLIIFGQNLVKPESPPLTAFLCSIQLFLDAFANAASGYRVLFISRPPITFYGLYGIGGLDGGTKRLITLIMKRGELADMLDCYLGNKSCEEKVKCQIMLDKILYDLDRAIDLYALGTDPNGDSEPEHRAAAYGIIIQKVFEYNSKNKVIQKINEEEITLFPCFEVASNCADPQRGEALYCLLKEIQDELWYKQFQLDDIDIEYTEGLPEKAELGALSIGFTSDYGCLGKKVNGIKDTLAKHIIEGQEAYEEDGRFIIPGGSIEINTDSGSVLLNVPTVTKPVPPELLEMRCIIKNMHQELCIQRDAEEQWESLLNTMTPSCIRFNGLLGVTRKIIDDAIDDVICKRCCPKFDVRMPPTTEESVDLLAGGSPSPPCV